MGESENSKHSSPRWSAFSSPREEMEQPRRHSPIWENHYSAFSSPTVGSDSPKSDISSPTPEDKPSELPYPMQDIEHLPVFPSKAVIPPKQESESPRVSSPADPTTSEFESVRCEHLYSALKPASPTFSSPTLIYEYPRVSSPTEEIESPRFSSPTQELDFSEFSSQTEELKTTGSNPSKQKHAFARFSSPSRGSESPEALPSTGRRHGYPEFQSPTLEFNPQPEVSSPTQQLESPMISSQSHGLIGDSSPTEERESPRFSSPTEEDESVRSELSSSTQEHVSARFSSPEQEVEPQESVSPRSSSGVYENPEVLTSSTQELELSIFSSPRPGLSSPLEEVESQRHPLTTREIEPSGTRIPHWAEGLECLRSYWSQRQLASRGLSPSPEIESSRRRSRAGRLSPRTHIQNSIESRRRMQNPIQLPDLDSIRRGVIQQFPHINITKEHIAKEPQCTICMEDFVLGDDCKQLPCEHFHHESCITPWLLRVSTCPNCRFQLDLPPPRTGSPNRVVRRGDFTPLSPPRGPQQVQALRNIYFAQPVYHPMPQQPRYISLPQEPENPPQSQEPMNLNQQQQPEEPPLFSRLQYHSLVERSQSADLPQPDRLEDIPLHDQLGFHSQPEQSKPEDLPQPQEPVNTPQQQEHENLPQSQEPVNLQQPATTPFMQELGINSQTDLSQQHMRLPEISRQSRTTAGRNLTTLSRPMRYAPYHQPEPPVPARRGTRRGDFTILS